MKSLTTMAKKYATPYNSVVQKCFPLFEVYVLRNCDAQHRDKVIAELKVQSLDLASNFKFVEFDVTAHQQSMRCYTRSDTR